MFRKYPIGLQNFEYLREEGYLYIDKTPIIHQLVTTGQMYFLTRPRCFGKSLLCSTIESLFKGSKHLFEGLWIYDKWDWTKTYSVIHLDFSQMVTEPTGFKASICERLERYAMKWGITLTQTNYMMQFRELIVKAGAKNGVVVLFDAYDSPITDFLENSDKIAANQEILENLYRVLKGAHHYIRFLLITGITPLNQGAYESSISHLDNITLTSHYGAIAGFTEREVEENFKQEIDALRKQTPKILEHIKGWYYGFTWNMQIWVYNPFSILSFMRDRKFHCYWVLTGNTFILPKRIKAQNVYDLEGIRLGSCGVKSFNAVDPSIGSLLYQTGYLTIKAVSEYWCLFDLGLPNKEIKLGLLTGLLNLYRDYNTQDATILIAAIRTALHERDLKEFMELLNKLIAPISNEHWKKNSTFLFTATTVLAFQLLSAYLDTEVHNPNRSSEVIVIVKTDLYIYGIQLELDHAATEEALRLINDKGYLRPYQADQRLKITIGIAFSSKDRQVIEYLTQEQ